MVPFELHYYRPDTIDEAIDWYQRLTAQKKHPAFYGGGTEILTRSRLRETDVDAVIDVKAISEVRRHRTHAGQWEFGAGLRLSEVADRNLWPLLTASSRRVADHTARGQITLGGNLLSVLPYREAMLPFLLMDTATITIAGKNGVREERFLDLYDQAIRLNPGELLVSVRVEGNEAEAQAFRSQKMTRMDWIDYPLVAISMTRRPDGQVRAAFSGWTRFPLVSHEVNRILSKRHRSADERAQDAVAHMPIPAISDTHGTRAYREFVTQYTLASMLKELEAEQCDN